MKAKSAAWSWCTEGPLGLCPHLMPVNNAVHSSEAFGKGIAALVLVRNSLGRFNVSETKRKRLGVIKIHSCQQGHHLCNVNTTPLISRPSTTAHMVQKV